MPEENQPDASGGMMDAGKQYPQVEIADPGQQNPSGEIAGAVRQPPAVAPPKSEANMIYVYAVMAVVLGLLVGIGFATMALRPAGRKGNNDLGTLMFTADGLKGHLVLNWDKTLGYRLAVEPSDPTRHAEFAYAVSNPPRPLSVGIELKDAGGYVLCMKTIVLKYDPAQAAAREASEDGPWAAAASKASGSAGQAAQAAEMARLEARELEREGGQDIFHNDIGHDGQIESISAQGEIPCSSDSYNSTVSWSFSPDFPSQDQQAALVNRETDKPGAASDPLGDTDAARSAASARRKAKKRAAEEPAAFALEGDDEVVGFDSSRGIIRTSTSLTFVISKTTATEAAARWQDLPANVHYKCDLNNACTLSRKGAMVLNAQLRR